MKRLLLISALGASALPALALTPALPPCSYDGSHVDGREIMDVWVEKNGFVVYVTDTKADRSVYYLEHCPSGKILRATSGKSTLPDSHPQSEDSLWMVLNDALAAREEYSVAQIQQRLRAKKIRTKRYTSKTESCACQANHPDARGSKTPYRKVSS